jgi:hypothetical protein
VRWGWSAWRGRRGSKCLSGSSLISGMACGLSTQGLYGVP